MIAASVSESMARVHRGACAREERGDKASRPRHSRQDSMVALYRVAEYRRVSMGNECGNVTLFSLR